MANARGLQSEGGNHPCPCDLLTDERSIVRNVVIRMGAATDARCGTNLVGLGLFFVLEVLHRVDLFKVEVVFFCQMFVRDGFKFNMGRN